MNNAIFIGVARPGILPARRHRHARKRRLAAALAQRPLVAVNRPAMRFPALFALGAAGGPLLLLVAAAALSPDSGPRARLVIDGCGFWLAGTAGVLVARAVADRHRSSAPRREPASARSDGTGGADRPQVCAELAPPTVCDTPLSI